jgi:hypothetical protein
MLELLQNLPQLTSLIEKLGTVGVLVIAVGFLIYERLRVLKLLDRAHRQRDRWRQIAERYRGAILAASAKLPDTADIDLDFAAYKED